MRRKSNKDQNSDLEINKSYRNSSVGVALLNSLEKLKQCGDIDTNTSDEILNCFDEVFPMKIRHQLLKSPDAIKINATLDSFNNDKDSWRIDGIDTTIETANMIQKSKEDVTRIYFK